MRYLREFEPRLVGAVLSGTATEHSEVQLPPVRGLRTALSVTSCGMPRPSA